MNQSATPLYDALVNYSKKNPISFHVPGHKNGKIFEPKGNSFFHDLLKLDATEITGLDDLHAPEEAIYDAQSLLADLFQTERSFFLVNGSTSGNLTMILAACEEDAIVLVQRNCHKSIMNALMLAKVRPVFLEPEYDPQWKVAGGVSFETINEALNRYPQVSAVILTYPNYYGRVFDLQRIIEKVHQFHIPVLIDEAHGAHFIAGDPFPPSAVQLGADIIVQSAHKTLPAMTMGSYLHFNSAFVKMDKVLDYLQIFQSSSPSYPIMASLDLARSYLGTYESADSGYLIRQINDFKQKLKAIPGLRVLDSEKGGDPLKITIRSTSGFSGYALQKRIEEAGVFTELADPYNVLLVFPLLKKAMSFPLDEAAEKINRALKSVQPIKGTGLADCFFKNKETVSSLGVSYKDMANYQIGEATIAEAAGKLAAETIIPYPPGIPLFLKGEEMTKEKLQMLQNNLELGARFQGGSLLEIGRVKVFLK
ncbi:aminotransferase class I/II-fold pyridoxal phosphate-dependent enzyme [Neobacillus sp. SM06]|uniref:aminotransferase class I/II-fold pyridoxal phosphate-dependent enzyme n=1 Tax=Neobacillus sp. SM06 TaxID=3422492 RepID=UPI003D2BA52C